MNNSNITFLEVYSGREEFKKASTLHLPLESFITYCIYKYCSPIDVILEFVTVRRTSNKNEFRIKCQENVNFTDGTKIPWQVSSCVYPVIMYKDTVITGLCAVVRHICKYRTFPQSPEEHEEGLLGFRGSCLQAPNEVSIWTKFCEIDLINTVQEMLKLEIVNEIPKNLVRFENHLNKPVKIHNIYKIARDLKKDSCNKNKIISDSENKKSPNPSLRNSKQRKWKSNAKKEIETKMKDLDLSHRFAEGPFLTLADLVLLPSYHILIQSLGETLFRDLLPLTYQWYNNILRIPTLQPSVELLNGLNKKCILTEHVKVPTTEDVSLYKCDPKRHNPKKRLFTKEDDIEKALSVLMDGMELMTSNNEFEFGIDWNVIPDGANPLAGHLPDERMVRKSQQLENLALAVKNIARDGDLIVDFCSGSGHLGILIAYLLPKSTVILLENKEQSLLRARKRVHDMGLKNVYFFQCNLDFFIGKFDIGIALHACGIASDLVLDKCLKANAKFVLCPCCYGSLHASDRLAYPRSSKFGNVTIDQYLCIGHAADQTHEEHPLTVRGDKCMAIIDSDRARLAEEFGYKVTLSRLKPLSCTPKNNLLIGVPS